MNRKDIETKGWSEYALIDSGEGRKLERFGAVILDRPDPQALWQKTDSNLWHDAHARYIWARKGERWDIGQVFEDPWHISSGVVRMTLSLGAFKHIGIFPEHSGQWRQLEALANANGGQLTMLNLFGYTGAASLAAAGAGVKVTHIDASKQTIAIVKENMRQSGLQNDAIRLVCEDALRYAKRLIARGEHFDIIVMDPPAFGRGPKGEVWKIEEKLPELVSLVPQLLSPNPQLVLLNGYAAGYSARSFGELLKDSMKQGVVCYGEVGINQTHSDRVLSTGIYAKWQPN